VWIVPKYGTFPYFSTPLHAVLTPGTSKSWVFGLSVHRAFLRLFRTSMTICEEIWFGSVVAYIRTICTYFLNIYALFVRRTYPLLLLFLAMIHSCRFLAVGVDTAFILLVFAMSIRYWMGRMMMMIYLCTFVAAVDLQLLTRACTRNSYSSSSELREDLVAMTFLWGSIPYQSVVAHFRTICTCS